MIRRSAALSLGSLVAALATACSAPKEAPWHQEQGYRWRELEVPNGRAGFTTMASGKTGIRFENIASESLLQRNRVLGQGAGVALGDVDGDGRVDVFLGRTEGCNALYRNLGGWRFEDVTASAGVGACDRPTTGATLADIDGDRDLDLILLATTGPNAIWVNDGNGKFAERRDLGLDTTGRGGTTATLADADGDGRLDLFVANYKSFAIDDSIPPQNRAFNQIVRQAGPNRYEVVPEHRANYRIVLRPDMGGLRMTTRAEPDQYYRNANGRFVHVPVSEGRFRDADGKPIAEEPESFGLVARFADLNADFAPDLFVLNDFEDTDELWFNDGRGGFRRASWPSQRQLSNSSMGADVADVDGDGLADMFVVDMLSKDTRRLKTQIPTHTALPKRPGDIETQLQQQRNTLFLNRGDGTFTEVGMLAGVQASGWSWSTLFTDVDLDGWQDILVTNGHLWDIMDADSHERLQNRFAEFHWQRFRWEFPRLPLKNVAFRNKGDLTFEDAGSQWGFGQEEDISHTMASGDLDGDGDQDIVVNRLGAPVLLLRSDAAQPRVAVRLVGDTPNTQGVGAKVHLLDGAVPRQQREIAAGGLYMSHSDYQATFAMGESDRASIRVEWRDGRQTVIEAVRPNRTYEISQSGATAGAGRSALEPPAPTLFEDATRELGGHVHVDPAYDDWERQFLLPNTLAQMGPGVAWFDYDRDGREDLIVGAGRTGRLGVFHNDGTRLRSRPDQGPVATGDFGGLLGIVDGRGARVIAAQSSWELTPAGAEALPAAVSISAGTGGLRPAGEPIGPPLGMSAGPVAASDYDGDGDLDLFLGGRAVPGAYPRAASSHLFRNTDGRWALDSANAGPLRDVGLVSAATFADLDGDGDADLLLAREWGTLLLLVNDKGRFTAAPAALGLERWTSRWNGVATGDLDGDGRLDIVATSWGRNTSTPADSARPLVLFHGPFGKGGDYDMLLGRFDDRIRAIAPLNSYPRARIAIPDLTDRVRSFAAYGDATIEQVLGPAMARVERRELNTMEHAVFLNRGQRFERVALPVEAQFAPAFSAGVADFDGDGAEDVFLAQNFFPTAIGMPRYDAGRGLLLRGDGRGGLAAMSAQRSGILVYGDQRGAAYGDYDGDGRLDLAISQNAAQTRLFRNRSALPGLRVRLVGPPGNPDAVGAQVRLIYADGSGPVREVQAGSGYWSQNGAVQVLGRRAAVVAVQVRWPGGAETRAPVSSGAREITIRAVGQP
jgi:hypothetical protein